MNKRQSLKFGFLLGIFLLTLVILVANVFVVSVMGYHLYTGTNIKPQADSIHRATQELSSRRGRILDTTGSVIASDSQTYDLVAIIEASRVNPDGTPAYVADKVNTAELVAPIIGMDPSAMLTILDQEGLYQVQFGNYSRRLSLSQKEQIEALELPGLIFYNSYDRQYPLGVFSSNLVGYATYDQDSLTSIGHLGVEQTHNQELVGTNGKRVFQQANNGYIIDDTTIQETPAINGQDVYLTLDQGIQETLEMAIETTKDQFEESSNYFGLVMEVETGRIIGMSQDPKLNLEDDPEEMVFTNYNFDAQLEPGSTFKAITFAAAIDSGNYDGDQEFDSSFFYVGIDENGKPYRSSTPTPYGVIQNAGGRDWGRVPFDNAFKHSLNVGTAELLLDMGTETFYDYMLKFGFSSPITTDRLTTSAGSINYHYPIEQLNTTFGQGVTVNPLQIAQAYSAILNDGVMVKPHYIDKIVDTNTNQVTYQSQTEIVGQPIKAETAHQVVDLMNACVEDEDGFCHIYDIEGTKVIGKTGTSQIVIDGKYDPDQHIHSVVLALPYDDPQVMVYFGYQADYSASQIDQKDGVKSLLKTLSLAYDNSEVQQEVSLNQLEISNVPHLINHSIDYAQQAVANTGLEVIKIGSGNQVINQLPVSNQSILSNQLLLVLTSQDGWLMPDMTNWSLKDITNFWSLTGIEVTTTGSGRVTTQSIPTGAEISSESKLEVILK